MSGCQILLQNNRNADLQPFRCRIADQQVGRQNRKTLYRAVFSGAAYQAERR
jgi:hypothetical protein